MKTFKRGTELNAEDRRHVLAAYIYRNTHENRHQNPAAVNQTGTILPAISDARWLEITGFAVTKNGRLDMRSKFCETHNNEVPEHATILAQWKEGQA